MSGLIFTYQIKGKLKEKMPPPIALFASSCYNLPIGSPCRTGGNVKKRKTLQDLTIKDNFLFGAVMSVEDN